MANKTLSDDKKRGTNKSLDVPIYGLQKNTFTQMKQYYKRRKRVISFKVNSFLKRTRVISNLQEI